MMHDMLWNPVTDHLVQPYQPCRVLGHAPGSSCALCTLLRDLTQRRHGVIPGDALSLVVHAAAQARCSPASLAGGRAEGTSTVIAVPSLNGARVAGQRCASHTAAWHYAIAECQRLAQAAQRAEHFALLGRQAAEMAHELRNALAALGLHVDLLEEELRTPAPDSLATVAEVLATMKTQLVRLNDVVQHYLTLARVPSLRRDVQDLGSAVQAWGREMQPAVATRGVTLQMQGLAGLGRVAFHADTLRRAFLNLVQNAADAMPQGGTVTLVGQGTATQVQLRVHDTGRGIPAEHLGQIFEPLYTTKPGGTGLGLAIVQAVVAAHEGRITVDSVVGQGTTFMLTLPRLPSDARAPLG